ncbi:cytosolic protein [Peribacillus sp. NPDC006672]|uniref:cytosolic protein n=1 Tax=Peribacillus sp. NPDC006672 TaxID=3390606 RepID=UPI003D03AFFE
MNTFIVGFHQEDNVDSMQVQKLTAAEFEKTTSRGFRRLFELDTNIGYFVFFDAEDDEGDLSHLVLQYEEDNQDPSDCYSFSKNDFYEFMALYLQGMDEVEDVEDDQDNEEYGPIHHLAHLMFHIVEEGKSVKP